MINKKWNKDDIIRFLRDKTGYIKKGPSFIHDTLFERGFETTISDCGEALQEVRFEVKTGKEVDLDDPRVLIYDIETSYLIAKSWRIGWKINLHHDSIIEPKKIICVSYKWLGEDQVYNLTWDENKDDKFLLEQFIEVMNEADLLVAHNGDKYDLRFIKTRALLQGLPMLVNYPQFDTLKVAKKKFMFDSNRLDAIAKDLGVGEKLKTGMQLWDDVILRQCPEAMQKMLDYCDMDVMVLENVYKKLVGWELPKLHAGVLQGKDKTTSPITGGKNLELVKTVTTNRGTIKRIMRDRDCNRLFEMSNTHYKKYIGE